MGRDWSLRERSTCRRSDLRTRSSYSSQAWRESAAGLCPHCPAFFDNCQVPLPDDLPPIPTATIGSYALPGWYQLARDHVSRGELAETDLRELVEDASTVALSDQEHAGLDVVSDGEVRRADFIMGFYDRLDGLRQTAPHRRLGP